MKRWSKKYERRGWDESVCGNRSRGWLEAPEEKWQEYTRRIARDAKIRLHAAGAAIPIMSTNAAHSILLG